MSKQKSISFYMEEELKKHTTDTDKNFFLCTWYRYMFPYIPFRTGLLASLMDFSESQENIVFSPEQALFLGLKEIQSDPRNVIHFKAPYAARQYEGTDFNFTRDLHPLAQANWAEVAADLHNEQIIKEYANFMKRSEK